MQVAVDVGGTFTDFVTLDAGRLDAFKVPTGASPEQGVLAGLDRVSPDRVTHASTVQANALIEDATDAALVTTRGFGDVVEIGDQTRLALYDLTATKPPTLVPEDLRFEVAERVDATGDVLVELDEADLDDLVARLAPLDVDAVAVCTLFSHLTPEHEARIAERLREAGYTVSASHEVGPEAREVPRTVTTVADAKVKRPVARYVARLRDALGSTPLHLMRSSGGVVPPDAYLEAPIRGVLSGPVGGVVAADHLADALDLERVLTLDMGGTSADLSRIGPDGPRRTHEFTFRDLPIRIPTVDVHTLGAGGGSIADLDPAGALTVGPASAGSDPGPACYDRGGTEPTVTDADVVGGFVAPSAFSGGVDLDPERARRAVERLAEEGGMDLETTVRGIRRVVQENMAHGARQVTLARGRDPRRHALMAYGGAGPLHACRVAEAVGAGRVVVPPFPGAFSALGLLVAEPVVETVRGVRPTTDPADVEPVVEELTGEVLDATRGWGRGIETTVRVDARHAGQAHTLTVPADDLPDAFHRAHERVRGHTHPDRDVEIVAVRVEARVLGSPPDIAGPTAEAPPDPVDHRDVLWRDDRHKTPAYLRDDLPAGWGIDGPAIVHDPGSTCAVPPGWQLTVHATGSLVLEAI